MTGRLKTYTLGCKVNQYETEYVRQGLHGIGFVDAAEEEGADVCIVNTCTVTAEGDSKSRQVIRRLARQNPAAKIVVMGCYATRAPDEVRVLPGVSEVVTDKRELPDLLGRFGVTDIPTGLSGSSHRARAYLKVQDGCMLQCSYCIIPQVRPQLSSRPLEHLVDEVRRLVDSGHRELVLTGIHLGHYGVEWNRSRPRDQWVRLATLVRTLANLPGDFRIRLSSIEATEVTRDLVHALAEHPDKVCPHLHVCLQSGSDRVLRLMRRRWGTRMFLDRLQLLRDSLDQPAFTTDIIVGFPGETEEDFQATCATARSAGFSKMHLFPFSPRRGTPAATMTDQIAPEIKQDRMERLAELEKELRRGYFQTLNGRVLTVVTEKSRQISLEDGTAKYLCEGTSCRYAPVEWESSVPPAMGSLARVRTFEAQTEKLLGLPEIE